MCTHHTVPLTGQQHYCTPPSHPSYSCTHILYTHAHSNGSCVQGLGKRPLPHLLTCTQGHCPLTIRCSTGRSSQVKCMACLISSCTWRHTSMPFSWGKSLMFVRACMHACAHKHTHASTCRPLLMEPHNSTHSLTHPHPPQPLTLHLPPPIPTCNMSLCSTLNITFFLSP